MSTDHVLIISGVAEARRHFADRVASDDAPLSLATLLPPPHEYPTIDAWDESAGELVRGLLLVTRAAPTLAGAVADQLPIHLWRAATWGTLSDVYQVAVNDERPDDDDWVLRYRFVTPTPPVPWLAAASDTDARLVLRLVSANGGWDVISCVTASGGRVIEERYGDYDEMAEDLAAARF